LSNLLNYHAFSFLDAFKLFVFSQSEGFVVVEVIIALTMEDPVSESFKIGLFCFEYFLQLWGG